jgi:hypothetical protein
MTTISFILALLAAPPQAGAAGPTGPVVFACDFGPECDRDCDAWPDGWIRRRAAGFHDFLKIEIVQDKGDPASGSVLAIDMNGGAAEAASPRIPVTPNFSYLLEGEYRLTELIHDDVHIGLAFSDSSGKVLETKTRILAGAPTGRTWQSFRLGPFTPHAKTAAAQFSLQVVPRGRRQDLKGQAAFRNFRLQRLPRMTLGTASPGNLFTAADQVEVLCEIAGIPAAKSKLLFGLFDHEGRCVATHVEELTTGADARARTRWKPPVPDYGFYRVKVRWEGAEEDTLDRVTSLAVLRPAAWPKAGEFGWSLPAGEEPLSNSQMAAVLSQAGVHWAKYPISFSQAEAAAADRIAWFAERLSLQGIEMVGVLEHPPALAPGPIASTLEDAELWKPWVDPIMTRLSLKVRWWQLGDDSDVSLVGYAQLSRKMQEVKKHLERFGQQVRLGAGWRWLNPPPASDAPLAMLNYSSDPPLTAAELEVYLTRPEAESSATRRWVTLRAIPRGEYSPAARAHDLVSRMIAAKTSGADAIFFATPFDAECGLESPDGAPEDLFLPWRTTAAAISGAQYLGQMQLPGGSTNHVFAREGEAVMAVWNDQPTEELMYFGEDLRQLDLWGRETAPQSVMVQGQTMHRIPVGTLPTFITGLNETIARWKMAVAFESMRVESIFNREQTIHLRLRNFLPKGVSGELRLAAPEGWKLETASHHFKLAAEEEIRLPIRIVLLAEASSGPQPLRLDFNLAADRNYQFNVQRTLQLGLNDVSLEMSSHLRDDGMLEITPQLTNFTNRPISFQCVLFPPDRRREAQQLMANPNGQSSLVFLLPHGEQLLGKKIVLRAVEVGGGRVLNYTITAER